MPDQREDKQIGVHDNRQLVNEHTFYSATRCSQEITLSGFVGITPSLRAPALVS